MPRTVFLPNGDKVEGVPDHVSDAQVIAEFNEPTEAETRTVNLPNGDKVEGVPSDVSDDSVFIDYGFSISKPQEESQENFIVNHVKDNVESTMSGFAEVGANLMTAAADVVSFADDENNSFVQNVRSQVEDVRKTQDWLRQRTADSPYSSAINEIGPTMLAYVTGGSTIFKALTAAKASAWSAGVLSGVVTDQLFADRNYNMANAATDLFPPDETATILEFLAAEEDDSIAEKRLKLMAEGIVAGGIVGVFFDTPLLNKVAQGVKQTKTATWEALDKSEKIQGVMNHFKEMKPKKKELIKQYDPELDTHINIDPAKGINYRTPEQILRQNEDGLYRATRQFFAPAGWQTPEMFNAWEGAVAGKRQLNENAQNIANRLRLVMADMEVDDELIKNIDSALRDEQFVLRLEGDDIDRLAQFSNTYSLDLEVGKEVLQARDLIDELSQVLANSNITSRSLKNTITDNLNNYVKRSYRLFEDADYIPTDAVRQEAHDFLVKDFMNADPKLSVNDANILAHNEVNSILERGVEDIGLAAHTATMRRINKDILKERKDIPEAIRKLMGEVEDPLENIVMTVAKLSDTVQNMRYFQEVKNQGLGSFIFDKTKPYNKDVFSHKIRGTNSKLDGLHTTPEIGRVLERREGRYLSLAMNWSDKNAPIVNKALHAFFSLKGMSQKNKTVYSHVTHARNFLGAMQFGVANGMNPFNEAPTAWNAIRNQVLNQGDEALDELYEEVLGLGLINTNVRINEFKALIREGEGFFDPDSWISGSAKWLERKGYNKLADAARAVDKTLDYAEDVYMATDDFFKLNAYAKELETLQAARPGESLADLKQEAASIVRNTYPSYDRVPPGIKGLRELPIGNFVAFPAEILRTSVNILGQARKEIMSGNEVLVRRGMNRAAGYLGSMSAWTGLSWASAKMAGLTEEEQKAINTASDVPWSVTEKLYFRDRETGELYVNYASGLNSYDYVRSLFAAPMNKILEGSMSDEEWSTITADASKAFFKHLTDPYTDTSIYAEGVKSVLEAWEHPYGENLEGKTLFPPGADPIDNFYTAIKEISKGFTPTSLEDIADYAYLDERDSISGATKTSLETELISDFTGIRFKKVDPVARIQRETFNYMRKSREKISVNASYGDDPQEVMKRYLQAQREEYDYQKQLYKHVQATRTLVGDKETYKLMRKAGMGQSKAVQMFRGKFTPTMLERDKIVRLFKQTYNIEDEITANDKPELKEFAKTVFSLYSMMANTSLQSFDKDKDEEGEYSAGARMLRAEGGLVTDPAMRRDPYTGRPYAATAEDLIDPLQRLGFVQGGYVRQQYSLGGQVIKSIFKTAGRQAPKTFRDKSVFRASESLAANPLTKEDLYQPTKISFMTDNVSKMRSESDMILGDEHTIFDMTDPAASEKLKSLGYEPQEGSAFVSIKKNYNDEEIPMFFQDEDEILEFYNVGVGQYDSLRGAKHSAMDAEFSKDWRSEEDLIAYDFIDPVTYAKVNTSTLDVDPELVETVYKMLDDSDENLVNLFQDLAADTKTKEFLEENIKPVSKDVVRRVKMSEPEGITVFHGSSADFDEFSREFDFTGEGNQAFGAGAYFTETKGIAKSYQDLASFKNVKDAPEDSIARSYTDQMDMTDQDAFLEEIDVDVVNTIDIPGSKMKFFEMNDGSAIVHQPWKKKEPFRAVEIPPQGTMYEVRLDIKEDELLDFDNSNTLNARLKNASIPKTDREIELSQLQEKFPSVDFSEDLKDAGLSGRDIYEILGEDGLRALGFKGIKYRDGFSRNSTGKGTYNYVVFDPKKDVTILKNNGENAFKKKFLRGSTVKFPVFRGSTHREATEDLLIAIQNPRELGVHVGANAGQPNTLLRPGIEKYMDDVPDGVAPTLKKDQFDEAFESIDPEKFYGSELKEGELIERGVIPDESIRTRMSNSNIAEYYINIKNPLKIDVDLGQWGADAIIPSLRKMNPNIKPKPIKVIRDMTRKLKYGDEFNSLNEATDMNINEYIMADLMGDSKKAGYYKNLLIEEDVLVDLVDQRVKEFSVPKTVKGEFKGGEVFRDAIEEQLGRKLNKEDWDMIDSFFVPDPLIDDAPKSQILREAEVYRSNRQFREWLQDLGFDSIEYKNTGEASFEGADQRSWIIFDHSQIKSARAESFDITDPRVSKAMGGLVRNRDKYAQGGMVPQPPEVMQPEAQEIVNPPLNQSNLQLGEQSVAGMGTGLIMRSLKRRFR